MPPCACWTPAGRQGTIFASFDWRLAFFLSATKTQITGNPEEAAKKGFVPKGRELETVRVRNVILKCAAHDVTHHTSSLHEASLM